MTFLGGTPRKEPSHDGEENCVLCDLCLRLGPLRLFVYRIGIGCIVLGECCIMYFANVYHGQNVTNPPHLSRDCLTCMAKFRS